MKNEFDWTVIGAGPAGIAAIGKLLDQGISHLKISWIDPYFSVGDLGRKWSRVPSNTSVGLFHRFLHACKAFDYESRPIKFDFDSLDPKMTCDLEAIVEPLQWITNHLLTKVQPFQSFAMALSLSLGRWEIKTQTSLICSQNVILAIGADAKTLNHAGPEVIRLETALDPSKLQQAIDPQDTVAVFGSSHSAILALANLIDLKPKSVINFYRSPHKYAVFFDDWILFDNTGLKGFSAKWAKQYIDGAPPSQLKRILTSDHAFDESLALCNKIVYAVGFERRKLPILEQYDRICYDDRTGIIAPGLFGCGIAFPEAQFNRIGQLEYRVGLWKFMEYLNSTVPIWMRYANL